MSKKNYNKIMKDELKKVNGKKTKLLIHSCCGPCSSQVLNVLKEYFYIEILFYNPNIHPREEYIKRLDHQIKLIDQMNLKINVIDYKYNPKDFFIKVKGYENLGEFSRRCELCIEQRLEETAKYAQENKFEYFTTSLTISPMKDAILINRLGEEIAKKYSVKFLNSDFKKEDGYKKSIDMSKKFNIYRQSYCGCIFSYNESRQRIK